MTKFFDLCVRYWRSEDGVSGLEYGMFAAGIALAIMVALFGFGDGFAEMFQTFSGFIAARLTDLGV